VLVENEVLTGGRERESLDTQFGGYKTFYRATPKDLVAGNDFENIERGKHGVTHPSGMSFVPIVRDSGLSRLGHQILDLCMPEMNGFEAATVLQKTMPQVPLFLFTSHQNRDVASQAASAGIRAVFSKQTDVNAVVAQASELLGGPHPQPILFGESCE
jgi:CheY-like chemotaxis protein